MSEVDIVAAISGLFGGRVYPDTAPHSTPRPFCIFSNVGGRPVNGFCGDADHQNARIQFDVWSDTRLESYTLMRDLAALVTAAPLHGTSLGSLFTAYDEVTRSRHARQDFSFWFPVS